MGCLSLHSRHPYVTFPSLHGFLKGFEEPLALAAGFVPEEPTARKEGHLGPCGEVAVAPLLYGVYGEL